MSILYYFENVKNSAAALSLYRLFVLPLYYSIIQVCNNLFQHNFQYSTYLFWFIPLHYSFLIFFDHNISIFDPNLTPIFMFLHTSKQFKTPQNGIEQNKKVPEIRVFKHFFYGLDGSRTRVQKPIPCPSTIIVNYLGLLPFPPISGNWHPDIFGSFIIRP